MRRTNQINELRKIVEEWDAWLESAPAEPVMPDASLAVGAADQKVRGPQPVYGDREGAVVETLRQAEEPLTITRICEELTGYDRTSISNALYRAGAKGKVRSTGKRDGREKLWEVVVAAVPEPV